MKGGTPVQWRAQRLSWKSRALVDVQTHTLSCYVARLRIAAKAVEGHGVSSTMMRMGLS